MLLDQGDERPITSSIAVLNGQYATDLNLIAAVSMITALPTPRGPPVDPTATDGWGSAPWRGGWSPPGRHPGLDEALVGTAEPTSTGTTDHHLDALTVTLPVPERAGELGTFTGRWTRELQPVRVPWPHGSVTAENHRGRTSYEHPLFAGTPGYGGWAGEVWGTHLAWGGNHVTLAERLADGRRLLQRASPP